ncbi:pyrroline-5-carboxylate reductase [Flavobacterium capsici]|uniref:Pyrroline-5-carboxylate reductase n=1 Tax=Flavobacterium capsici TaxID=3075618 RepID=A0AA96J6I0_9FLAO|nr:MULTISPECIES: pyrroline-5-carboxylate reductase [unclassified Flavobacterium]WNM20176.1 pyrroline-5-carboxylate reductase [Flavobacterium sp. PMR2A8]WNM21566.1 pyrroline-5-carboxylate reductase [Flavobacterium sp. PMTSA4]
MKVAIIGFGNMGKTYANSFISSRFIKTSDIYAFVKENNEVSNLGLIPVENYISSASAILHDFDIVILSVKPQDFSTVAKQIKPFLKESQLILSVMAGVTIDTISNELNCSKIVRSMPNIPTQIGQGMTVFTASSTVDRKELFIIQNLINTTGKSVYVEDESLINAATAISGSGPAYVFYFMQSMINAAVELGFNESEAELLVNQTFRGSVSIQNSANLSNNDWIKKVTSKGGTTESALSVFEKNNLEKTIIEGILAANKRAIELGS